MKNSAFHIVKVLILEIQCVSQEGKKVCVFHELGNKTHSAWVLCEPFNGFSGEPGGKALKKFTIFRLKLV